MQIIKGKKESNGCGFGPVAKLLPDLDFGPVCHEHDINTMYGGGIISYLAINLGFYVDLLYTIEMKPRPWYETFLMFLYATFMGVYVVLFNWLFFNWRVV